MWIIGAVVSLLLIALAVSSTSSRNTNNHTPQRNSNTKKHSAQKSPAFTASKYNFKINFPSDPSVTDEKIEASKDNPVPIPYTSYNSSDNNDSQVYSIVAYNWPKQDVDFPGMSRSDLRKSLTGFVNSDMQEFSGTITNIKDKYIFSGHTLAEEGQFSMPSYYGSASLGYIRVFTVGNFEYDIITTGTDKNAFENFADSFQSTGSGGISKLAN